MCIGKGGLSGKYHQLSSFLILLFAVLVELGLLVLLEIVTRRKTKEFFFFLIGIFTHLLDDDMQVGDSVYCMVVGPQLR